MDFQEILTKSFNIYRGNLKIVIPIIVEYLLFIAAIILAFLALGLIVLSLGLSVEALDLISGKAPELPFAQVSMIIFLVLLLFFVFWVIASASRAAVIGMGREALELGTTSLATGWASLQKHTFSIMGFHLLLFLVMCMGLLVSFIPVIVGTIMGSGETAIVMLAIFSMFIYMVYVMVINFLFFLTPQMIVIQDRGVMDAFGAASSFARANIFQILVYVAFIIFLFILVGVIFFPLGIIAGFMDPESFGYIFLNIMSNLLSFLVGILIRPYYDLVKNRMVMGDDLPATPQVEDSIKEGGEVYDSAGEPVL